MERFPELLKTVTVVVKVVVSWGGRDSVGRGSIGEDGVIVIKVVEYMVIRSLVAGLLSPLKVGLICPREGVISPWEEVVSPWREPVTRWEEPLGDCVDCTTLAVVDPNIVTVKVAGHVS